MMPELPQAHALSRHLGVFGLLMLGVGSIVGAGIYVLPGLAAARYAGPSVCIAFIIAAIGCGFVALCYAELASRYPKAAGGAYGYIAHVFGSGPAWWVGWMLLLEYGLAGSVVADGLIGYLRNLLSSFALHFPAGIAESTIQIHGTEVATAFQANAAAACVIGLSAVLLSRGVAFISKANVFLVTLKLAVLISFVAIGVAHIHLRNWHPFIPPSQGFLRFGWPGILRAVAFVSFAYLGFDLIAVASPEARTPSRDVPVAIICALGLSALLYVIVALVMTGLVPYSRLGGASPISEAIAVLHWPNFGLFIQLGAVFGLMSVLFASLYGQSRLLYAMARDNVLPALFLRLSPSDAPLSALWVGAFFTALLSALLPIELVADLVSLGTMTSFIGVALAVLRLRREDKRTLSASDTCTPNRHKSSTRKKWLGMTALVALILCGLNCLTVLSDMTTEMLRGNAIPLSVFIGYVVIGKLLMRRKRRWMRPNRS